MLAFSVADASVIVGGLVFTAAVYQTRTTAKQFKPNGGSSMRDAVDRIESTLKLQNVVLTQHSSRLDTIEEVVTKGTK